MIRKIRCKRCGACARTTKGLNISAKEAKAIKGKIPLWFIKNTQYAAKIPLRENVCIAFKRKGGRGACKIYRVRPAICRQYPVIFFNGRAILQRDCSALKDLLAEGRNALTRQEVKGIPFLAKSLRALEKFYPQVKKQNVFEITNA